MFEFALFLNVLIHFVFLFHFSFLLHCPSPLYASLCRFPDFLLSSSLNGCHFLKDFSNSISLSFPPCHFYWHVCRTFLFVSVLLSSIFILNFEFSVFISALSTRYIVFCFVFAHYALYIECVTLYEWRVESRLAGRMDSADERSCEWSHGMCSSADRYRGQSGCQQQCAFPFIK